MKVGEGIHHSQMRGVMKVVDELWGRWERRAKEKLN
jgi:hypothetical protein